MRGYRCKCNTVLYENDTNESRENSIMTVNLEKVKDTYDNDYEETRLGFEWEGFFITDPTTSECGRFHIPRYDVEKTYGITEEQRDEMISYNRLGPENGQRYGA